MRLKKANVGACICALASLVVLSGVGLTAVPALALNPERHYEMVSPVYKGGYGANGIEALAIDGESVAFVSLGAFAGAPSSPALNSYLARRGASGWSTVPLMAPAAIAPWVNGLKSPSDFSPTLDTSLTFTKPGANYGAAFPGFEGEYLLHPTGLPDNAAGFSLAGQILATVDKKPLRLEPPAAPSADFSHIVLTTGNTERLLEQAPVAENEKGLYDMSVNGPGAPSLKLVALKNNGELIDRYCGAALGTAVGKASKFNAIVADGAVIFFTTNANEASKEFCDGAEGEPGPQPQNPAIVYARLAGQRTLQISAPLAADCEVTAPCHAAPQMRAEFVGADEAGAKVFFETSQPLVSGDRDTGNDLYMATIGCPSGRESCAVAEREVTGLTQVSRDPTAGQAAEVQGTVRMAGNGSRVYLVARGVLTSGPNAEGRTPVLGADNLYVYDSVNASMTFVADLCSGPGASGESGDSNCPATLTVNANDTAVWNGNAETAGDGRFLVFESFARLAGGDSDTRKDVYRYDSVTGVLDRVSVGEDGYDANGNSNSPNADAYLPQDIGRGLSAQAGRGDYARLRSRSVSEDGSRIIFVSAEPLSPHAINGLENLYEWHKEPGWSEGRVSLVSSGNSTERVTDAVISPSGRDLAFVTSQGLVPQDTDGAPDVYDARLGGGFPAVPAPAQPCSGDACQGPLTNSAPLLVPGSLSQAPGENLASPAPQALATGTTKGRVRCSRGKTLSHGRCVKAKGRRHAKHKRGGAAPRGRS
ncbi:MAG TPA: hypothetical protein VNY27_00720 [Solirubrobacteraceae bacterium]|jgi:hypothetical protein|nr:hypothetical protein [Solirubrobacteraceae bacterium]